MFFRNDVNIGDWHENKARHEQSRFNAVIASLEAISSLKKIATKTMEVFLKNDHLLCFLAMINHWKLARNKARHEAISPVV
jgi:hypothetical protein